MRIAVLSGKGGAGKTLVAVNLASVIEGATYVDCDVEEPNGALFLQPTDVESHEVSIALPKWNSTLCDGCKKCVDFCAFNALAYVKSGMMVFDEICHSCGGCAMVCPHGAITWRNKPIGRVETGKSGDIRVISGLLNMGEASGIPIISEAMRLSRDDSRVIIDCPPGSACSVMESIKDADICVLVAEPTIFGVHNLDMVVELARTFNKRMGVVLNKEVEGESVARDYCIEHNLPIFGSIKWDRSLGTLVSNGKIATHYNSEFRENMKGILANILEEVAK